MVRARTPPQAETGWIEEAPSNEEAIECVTMKQVERGHWSNEAKEYYYAKRAAALGVRTKAENQHVTNVTSSPSQEEHADALGVSSMTVNRWEKDRKEIMSDPELAATATTPEGYKEAKKVVRDRRETAKRKGLLYALAPLKQQNHQLLRHKKCSQF